MRDDKTCLSALSREVKRRRGPQPHGCKPCVWNFARVENRPAGGLAKMNQSTRHRICEAAAHGPSQGFYFHVPSCTANGCRVLNYSVKSRPRSGLFKGRATN